MYFIRILVQWFWKNTLFQDGFVIEKNSKVDSKVKSIAIYEGMGDTLYRRISLCFLYKCKQVTTLIIETSNKVVLKTKKKYSGLWYLIEKKKYHLHTILTKLLNPF